MKKILFALLAMVASSAWSQIYEPEGLHMPGAWNGFTNPPTNNLALANPNQVSGGRLVKITQGQPRWQTIFSVAASSGDVVGGAHEFVFSSGPSGSPWNNTWTQAIPTRKLFSWKPALNLLLYHRLSSHQPTAMLRAATT